MSKPLKEVFVPHLNRTVKFGRKRSRPRMSVKLSNYLLASLPDAPATTNFRASATDALAHVYMNDSLGDCVIAGRYHRIGLLTGLTGKSFIATDAQVVADYSAIGGYIPGDQSTDQGCDMATAADYGVSHGYADGSKDFGWLAIDATNKAEVASAMWLFENLDFGLELPDAWVQSIPNASGFTWDVAGAPDPENGHCIEGVDIATNGIVIATWGMTGTLTWAAIAMYAAQTNGGEIIVHLSEDQLAKAQTKAPNGVAWADLIADFDALGGHVTPVAPVTPPAPSPAPGAFTLEGAQAAVDAALKTANAITTRSHATSLANAALKTYFRG